MTFFMSIAFGKKREIISFNCIGGCTIVYDQITYTHNIGAVNKKKQWTGKVRSSAGADLEKKWSEGAEISQIQCKFSNNILC